MKKLSKEEKGLIYFFIGIIFLFAVYSTRSRDRFNQFYYPQIATAFYHGFIVFTVYGFGLMCCNTKKELNILTLIIFVYFLLANGGTILRALGIEFYKNPYIGDMETG